jgi:hypothetical protein
MVSPLAWKTQDGDYSDSIFLQFQDKCSSRAKSKSYVAIASHIDCGDRIFYGDRKLSFEKARQ